MEKLYICIQYSFNIKTKIVICVIGELTNFTKELFETISNISKEKGILVEKLLANLN